MRNITASAWDSLLASQSEPTPFMRHAYLCAMEESASACPETGWTPQVICLYRPNASPETGLAAAAVLYIKPHSYGEYVFDWAWADAYHRHGLDYYPKAVGAVPFTPVPGSRLLADSKESKAALIQAMVQMAQDAKWSSVHVLFLSGDDHLASWAICTMA